MPTKMSITKTSSSNISSIDFDNIPFGKVFTDHMFIADYEDGKWGDARIVPVAPIPTHPGNLAWHYGQAIFEGMKASRDDEGNALLFRPEEHSKRINHSATRLCMPEIPKELFLDAVHTLVNMEKAWIPPNEGSALYIRPFMFANDATIGVRASETYRFIIFCMPVGPYYPKPVSLYADKQYVRAVKGGVGEAKAAGNYAASLYPAMLARQKGYDQVMWLDAVEHKYIQEVGTMNIFFVIGDTVVTPATDGAILKGITRNSIITILKDQNYKVEERPITIDELIAANKSNELKEVFGAGTAAVVSEVYKLCIGDEIIELATENFKISKMVKSTINQIRIKKVEDKFGWLIPAENRML